MTDELHPLGQVAATYWRPDPEVVSKLKKRYQDKNGEWREYELDYVGHADLTRTLIEIDPEWDWEPYALNQDGLPAIYKRATPNAKDPDDGELVLWIRLTLLGKTRIGVGNCDEGKHDADKELVGDALRNAAMRFGIFGGLWSKATAGPEPARAEEGKPAGTVARRAVNEGHPTAGQCKMIFALSKKLFQSAQEEVGFFRHVTGLEGVGAGHAEELTYAQGQKVIDALKAAEAGTWPKGWDPLKPGEEPF